jgi:DNA polymerase III alpha subunit
MVISPGPITDIVSTQLASKGVRITQFDLESVSHLGLVKIDLLGIRGLTVLGDVAQELQSRSPGTYASSLDALDEIPDQDSETGDLLQNGQTIGCFQIESPGMRATLKEIQARTMNDLMIALALYRPGPLTGGLKDAFIRRHRGEEEISHLHPALSVVLEETYGVILYQEQVLRIAHELAGLSLADADLLRRAMSHFDPGEQMVTLKEKFISGAWEQSQIPADIAEHVWELMAAFAGYGFPKAHAASYAQISWRSAWSKAHYPEVFMAAVLANWGGYYRQPVYLNEARRLGIKLHAPHVNYSQRQFSVSDHAGEAELYMGLDQVRELTRRTQKRILKERPFNSLADFLTRVDPRPMEAENLIHVGAFEGLGEIPQLLNAIDQGG